ncbi:MAG: hypothetical protein J2P52_02715, partial [Blastocatellia bacterium]|nr:hypothetical protein [Blastocatellia bacterium]
MKTLRPTMTVLFSIPLSIGFIVSGSRSQQPTPKPNERTGGAQAPGKRQGQVVPAPSKKKAPKDTTRPADEEGAILKVENKPNIAELRQKG